MKTRADYKTQTMEDKIVVESSQAVSGVKEIETQLKSLYKELRSCGNVDMAKGIKQYTKQLHSSISTANSQLSELKGTIKNSLGTEELKKFNNSLKNTGEQGNNVVNAIKKTINFSAIALGARQALSTLSEMTNASVDYAETVNLFNVSFGKGIDGLNQYYEKAIEFQETLEEKLGVNIGESMKYQALFNSMTKSMGLGAEYAYTLSENLTKLGYDLASLYNIDTQSAMTKLRAGLAGETEPLRALGLDITEQSLGPVAESLGITESIRNMSQAEKTVLRYITVLRQAQIAQGDFANTMESPANQLRIFNAQVTAFKRNMGNLWQGLLGNILPYINAIMMVINELLKMVAKLFGFEVYNQPVNISASVGADDLADDFGTASDNLGDAGKKAKELKRQLMGFDEINNITLNDDTSSGSGGGASGGASVGGIDQRLLDALKGYDNLMDRVSNKATEIRDKILDWLGVTDGTYENLKRIWEVVKSVGSGLLTWKLSKSVLDFFKNLGMLKNVNTFKMAFGIGLTVTGIMAQYNGTQRLLNGDISIFSLLETFLGTAGGTFGIVNVLRSISNASGDKIFKVGEAFKIGLGVMLTIQGVQVLTDGIKTGDVSKIILGSIETTLSGTLALKTLLGNKSIKETINNLTKSFTTFGTKAKNVFSTVVASASSFGSGLVTAFKGGTTGIKNFASSLVNGTSGMSTFVKTGGTMIAGLAGIAGGSALSYATMKDFTTGTIGTTEAIAKMTAGLGVATASGILAGSQFGLVGMAIGGVAGFTTSAITAFMGYKDGIESLNIPTTTLTDEINALTQEVDENRQAHEQAVQSIKDTYENQMVEAEYADKLSQQLLGLVDANGKVKKGNEERADFILGELNKALGTEYKLNDNLITNNGEVVDSYKKLQKSIKDTIEQKKKEAEQEVNAELYKENLKQQIKLEREKADLIEKQAQAQKEYDELMAKYNSGEISKWTLTHNENYEAIIENYTNITNKLKETREEYWKVTDDVNYYSQQMTEDIIESTQTVSEEMFKQGENHSETLQKMVKDNTKAWEENYDNLNDATKTAMLAQSTTLDTWSPTIEQKWKDMANNSAENFLNAISQVEPQTQAKILKTITTTENLTPEMVEAWSNLGTKSKDDFNEALSSLPEDVKGQILASVIAVQGMNETTTEAYRKLGNDGKKAFNKAMSSMDTDTKNKVQSVIDEINGKQGKMNKAGSDLAKEGIEGADARAKDSKKGIKSVGKWFVQGFLGQLTSKTTIGKAFKAGADLISAALRGGNETQETGSPAKQTIKMGNFYTEGYILGIKKKALEVKKVSSNLVGMALNELNKINENGFSINSNDFKIDTTQFVDYGAIVGNINTRTKVEMYNLSQEVRQAVIDGMSQVSIPIEVEARTDEGVVFTKIQRKAQEFAMQTNENPFPVLI